MYEQILTWHIVALLRPIRHGLDCMEKQNEESRGEDESVSRTEVTHHMVFVYQCATAAPAAVVANKEVSSRSRHSQHAHYRNFAPFEAFEQVHPDHQGLTESVGLASCRARLVSHVVSSVDGVQGSCDVLQFVDAQYAEDLAPCDVRRGRARLDNDLVGRDISTGCHAVRRREASGYEDDSGRDPLFFQ